MPIQDTAAPPTPSRRRLPSSSSTYTPSAATATGGSHGVLCNIAVALEEDMIEVSEDARRERIEPLRWWPMESSNSMCNISSRVASCTVYESHQSVL